MMRLLMIAALTIAAAPAFAQSPVAPPAAEDGNTDIVVVGDDGSANALSGDSLRDAAQAFQRHRATYAPAARFVFRVDPVAGEPFDTLDLRLRNGRENAEGGHDRIDLAIGNDGLFELPVAQVLSGDWGLRSSSRARLSIRPLILSPGGTQFDRRFGDVRLQCRVYIAFVRLNLAMRALAGAANVCNRSNVGLYLITPRPIDSVTIAGWSEPITIRPNRLSFRVPLHEDAISNDARMTVRFR